MKVYPPMSEEQTGEAPIHGYAAPEFEPVRRAFVRNFELRLDRGAACTIYHRGVKVVDLWGGYRRITTEDEWTRDTMTLAFSVTKGMAAAAMAVAHSRGMFCLNEPVATYWPEFAYGGKQRITVRQLLAHQAGLVTVGERLTADQLADHQFVAKTLARQKAMWEPGTRHGYHTLTLGWYQNELIRRTDPLHRSLGQFFQDEIAEPLGVDFYIGLPADIDEDRISEIHGFNKIAMLLHLNELPVGMVLAGAWPTSLVARSINCLKINNPAEIGSPMYRHVEIPSANGIGTARGVARVYDALARGGQELGITQQTRRELVEPAIGPSQGSYDAILKVATQYKLGFSRPSEGFQFGADESAFGCPGAGGSFGMGDPSYELGFAYLTNRMGFRLFDDPREKALRDACYACVRQIDGDRVAA